jgi:hypothetical protein
LVNLAQQQKKKKLVKKYNLVIDELPKFRVLLEQPFQLKDNMFVVKVTSHISVSSRENKCTDDKPPPSPSHRRKCSTESEVKWRWELSVYCIIVIIA